MSDELTAVEAIILGARQLLPEAFANGPCEQIGRADRSEIEAAQPLLQRAAVLEPDAEPLGVTPQPEPLVQAVYEARNFGEWTLPASSAGFSEADREATIEVEAAHREGGFEVFAVYVPFHCAWARERWGIFYRREAIRRLALLLMREARIGLPEAPRVALELVRAHERYHFRFEFGALSDELCLGKPLYNAYAQHVYKKALFTPYCFEESLANRAVTLVRFADPQLPHAELQRFAMDLCANAPPGYRDFNRDVSEMRECLLGQLKTTAMSSRTRGPESDWLASWTRHSSPEYVIGGYNFPTGKFITCKRGGYVWILHPHDPDPWPSKPHAHEYEHRWKLSLSTGEVFLVPSRTRVNTLRRKDLEDLRGEIARKLPGLPLPILAA